MNQDIYRVPGNEDVPIQNIGSALRKLIVCGLLLKRIAHLNILGDSVDTFDTLHRGDGRDFFSVAVDVPAKADDILVDGNANVLAVKTRVEFQLVDNVLPEFRVGHVCLHH